MNKPQRTFITVIAGVSDTTAPTVAITSTESSPTAASPIPITITFSEEVTGFVVGDLTVGNGSAGDFATADNIVFTANVTPDWSGNVTVGIAAGVCTDLAGNPNEAAAEFTINAIATLVLQPDSTTGADAMIETEFNPTINYADLDLLQMGESTISGLYRSFIKFDLSSIPATAIILSASLELTIILNGDQRASVTGMLIPFVVLRNWVLAQVTATIWSTGNNWAAVGAFGAGDVDTLGIGFGDFFTTDVVGDKKTVPLTPLQVQNWTSGAVANYGLLLKMISETNNAYRVGSCNHATAGNRPELTVVYAASNSNLRQITFGGDSKSNENDAWPILLLDALYAEGDIYYENPARLAVAGYTAAQLHAYVDANIGALSGNPEAVLLNIGANDLSSGTSETTYKAELTGIIDAYLAKYPTTTVYVGYPWRQGYDAPALTMKGWIDDVIASYPGGVAAGHDENVWLKPNVAALSYDGTHYNYAGSVQAKNQWMAILGY